jgi:hypothetical protein
MTPRVVDCFQISLPSAREAAQTFFINITTHRADLSESITPDRIKFQTGSVIGEWSYFGFNFIFCDFDPAIFLFYF